MNRIQPYRRALAVFAVITLFGLVSACGTDPESSGGSGGAADTVFLSPFSDSGIAVDSQPSDAGQADSSPSTDASAPVDTAETPDPCAFPKSPAPGEAGAACSTNTDCDSQWCIDTADGQRCTKTCVDCCPGGWKCEQAPASDTTFICVPKLAALCLPCATDAECGAKSPGALCILRTAESELEGASFCGGECKVNADCPADYACDDTQGEKGAGKQCVPKSGMCGCSELAVKTGAEAYCTVTNNQGTCAGTRKCDAKGLTACSAAIAAVETCNGVDDDCDAETDENVAAQACETKNAFGACKGTTVCDGATLVCTAVEPEAEKCDGKDNDCDGVVDEGCDDDGDGYCATDVEIVGLPAVCSTTAAACNGSGAVMPAWCSKGVGDCNDAKADGAAIHPGANEACGDSIDNDCDGKTDVPNSADPEPAGCKLYYADEDNDGVGAGKGACLCAASNDFNASQNTDCNDKDKSIAPGQQEICGNGIDDNCDNDQNENGAKNCLDFWVDEDGDGFGGGESKCFCEPKGKYKSKAGGDCDDTKKPIHPKAVESCDGVDNNCDGATDEADSKGCKAWFVDVDGDGYGDKEKSKCLCAADKPYTTLQGGDCDDNKTTQNPGWKELCHDSIDNNCNGATDEEDGKLCIDLWQDLDGDGYGNSKKKKCLCDKDAANGYTVTNGKDCNDDAKTGKAINPDAKEICDGKDNDCSGQVDNGCDLDGDGYCSNAKVVIGKPKSCPKGGGDCNDDPQKGGKSVHPAAKEICNGADDNCKGGTDEGCDDDGDGYCDKNMVVVGKPSSCSKGGGDCNDKSGAINPGRTEICNNINDDCDSLTDEGCDDDKDGYCDKNMTVVGIPSVCSKGPGDCCDVDSSARPKQTAWYGNKNKCGSYDYNCSGTWEKRWTIKAAPYHDAGKAECLAKPAGWPGAAPSCGTSAAWVYDFDWDGSFAIPLVKTCKILKTEQKTQQCH